MHFDKVGIIGCKQSENRILPEGGQEEEEEDEEEQEEIVTQMWEIKVTSFKVRVNDDEQQPGRRRGMRMEDSSFIFISGLNSSGGTSLSNTWTWIFWSIIETSSSYSSSSTTSSFNCRRSVAPDYRRLHQWLLLRRAQRHGRNHLATVPIRDDGRWRLTRGY